SVLGACVLWPVIMVMSPGGHRRALDPQPGLELVGIFGGCDVSARRFPWQVSLRFYSLRHDQRRHACGGSLIHPQWVLSAAHCVQLYDHDQLTRVAKIIRHPQFNESLAARGGADIAPLELEAPTMLSEHVHPISLPPASLRVPLGKTCWVTGWPLVLPTEPLPPPYPLQEVDVPLVGNDDCARQYQNHSGGSSEVIRGDVLCTGREGRDSCQGDSRALVCRWNCSWVQVGVGSWGSFCGHQDFPGVYTRVTSYVSWIRQYVPGFLGPRRVSRGGNARLPWRPPALPCPSLTLPFWPCGLPGLCVLLSAGPRR
uniref:Peptidase S1 domain-containing protein n=1 Tax=Prolemur simus TaxID=1328070 RepID=A0A8C9B3T0_PROSS